MNTNGKLQCKTRCLQDDSYEYFGVQFGRDCFCGNDIKTSFNRVSDEECNIFCSGNTDELCGGFWKIYIFTNE